MLTIYNAFPTEKKCLPNQQFEQKDKQLKNLQISVTMVIPWQDERTQNQILITTSKSDRHSITYVSLESVSVVQPLEDRLTNANRSNYENSIKLCIVLPLEDPPSITLYQSFQVYAFDTKIAVAQP